MIEKTVAAFGESRLSIRSKIEKLITLAGLAVLITFAVGSMKPRPTGSGLEYRIFEDVVPDRPYMDFRRPTLNPSKEHLHEGNNAMVASDVPLCSKMGTEILKKGGNAADAAVTIALCIGSVNSFSSGIGGGGFIVSSLNSTGEVKSINAREVAPKRAHMDMYASNPQLSMAGGLAVAVPGELKGLHALFKLHGSGRLKWSDLFQPVVNLNIEGFKVSPVLGFAIEAEKTKVFPLVPEIAESWDFIYKEDGSLIKANDTMKRPSLARCLGLIAANESSDIFYDPEGPIVSSLLNTTNRLGGILSAEDFADYDVQIEDALEFNLTIKDNIHRVFTSSSTSSGLALIAGLNFFGKIFDTDSSEILQVHRLVESMKWITSARSHLGDLSANSSQRKYYHEITEQYTSEEWPEQIMTTGDYSDRTTFPWEHYHTLFELTEPHGTSHFSVVDKDGNAVAMTTTINLLFGSMVYDNATGIILNNEMDDFSQPNRRNAFNLTPSALNFIEPGKRPLSSSSPAIVMTKNLGGHFLPDFVVGAAGGSHIVTAVFQAIVRIYYYSLPLLETVSYPRTHHQLIPEYIMSENITTFAEEYKQSNTNVVSGMESMDHTFVETGTRSVLNAIKRKDIGPSGHQWQGVGDYWRKLSGAYGY